MSSESNCWKEYQRGERVCCVKPSSRRIISPILLLLTVIILIVASVMRVSYLFIGYMIFILCIIASGACESCYNLAASFQVRTFACCRRSIGDDDEEITVENGSQETLTAWATRSLSTNEASGSGQNRRIVLPIDSETAPPCYNDVIINDEMPPPSYHDAITKCPTNTEESGDG